MYELMITEHFAAGHHLVRYQGRCERPHGHNYRVDVFVAGKELNEEGMLVDYEHIKKATDKALDALDHFDLNELKAFARKNTTTENIAAFLFIRLKRVLNDDRVQLTAIRIWESDEACCLYREA